MFGLILYVSPLPYFVDKMWAVGALRTMMVLFSRVVLWSLFRHDDARESSAELQRRNDSERDRLDLHANIAAIHLARRLVSEEI